MQLFFVLYNVLSTVVCLSTPFCLGTKWLIIVAFRNLIYEYRPRLIRYIHCLLVFLLFIFAFSGFFLCFFFVFFVGRGLRNMLFQWNYLNTFLGKQIEQQKNKQTMDVSYQSGLSFNTFVLPTSIHISFEFKSLSSLRSYHKQLHCFHRNVTTIDIFL
jgi:hypothetical protein